MKVLFVNPSLDQREYNNPVAQALFANAMPLGICYLAAVLEQAGIAVDVLDAAAERLSHEDVRQYVQEGNFDVLGITCTTNGFYRAVGLACHIKEWAGDSIPIILGGHHMTDLPDHAMSFDCFDYGVAGEGEHTILELLEVLAGKRLAGQCKGIAYREDDQVIYTAPRPLIDDLDTIPFPARHLLRNTEVYHSLLTDVQQMPKLSIVANRGCPFKCAFCSTASMGNRYRTPSAAYHIREIQHLQENFGVKEIFFVGSTFTASRERTEEFCDLMLQENIKVSWTASTRVDVVDRELLKKMKAAGCWRVRLGIESGSQEVMNFIKKAITKERVRQVADMCHEIGISTKGFFIIGHLIDTKETIEETIDFAVSLPLADVTVQLNTPLPGTPQYDLAEFYGSFRKEDFSKFNFFEPVFVPKGLTKDYLIKKQKELYRRFYLKPQTIMKHLGKLKSPYARKYYIQGLGLFAYLALTRNS